MKTTMPILWKREDWIQHLAKLSEEFTELCHELHDAISGKADVETIRRLLSEVFDVGQVLIGIADKAAEEYDIDIKEELDVHYNKLMKRGWGVKGWIDIEVKMGGI